MESGSLTPNAIPSILAQLGIRQFDLAVINGREFTGFAELQQVYGCETIILECTQTFKNQRSLDSLSQDPAYELLFAEPDIANGLAVFTKR